MDFLKLFFSASCFPDWVAMGLTDAQEFVFVLVISSLATIAVYFANNYIFIQRLRLKFSVGRKFLESIVHSFGYIGIVILALFPLVVGFRETALITGQSLGLSLTLPLVLSVSALRLYVMFIYRAEVWFFIKLFVSSLLAVIF